MDIRTVECGCLNGRMDGRLNGRKDGMDVRNGRTIEWTDGMDGMDGRTEETDGRDGRDGRLNGRTEWTDVMDGLDGRTYGRDGRDGRTYGRDGRDGRDGWMDGWTDGRQWMDGRTNLPSIHYVHPSIQSTVRPRPDGRSRKGTSPSTRRQALRRTAIPTEPIADHTPTVR